MGSPDLEKDLPITRRWGFRSYVFANRNFFTRWGADNYRADFIILNAVAKGYIR